MGYFDFISNPTLCKNLDITFDHIVTLLSLVENKSYDKFEQSSFRKTIIIYTASIIEALLFDLVMRICQVDKLTTSEWKIENVKVLYKINPQHQIVGGDYLLKSIKQKPDKMNLGIILNILHKNKYIGQPLYEKIDKVRVLRNDQHFGTHQIIREYTKGDLEFVFSVAKEVKSTSKMSYAGTS
jgi:hypothetical protein